MREGRKGRKAARRTKTYQLQSIIPKLIFERFDIGSEADGMLTFSAGYEVGRYRAWVDQLSGLLWNRIVFRYAAREMFML